MTNYNYCELNCTCILYTVCTNTIGSTKPRPWIQRSLELTMQYQSDEINILRMIYLRKYASQCVQSSRCWKDSPFLQLDEWIWKSERWSHCLGCKRRKPILPEIQQKVTTMYMYERGSKGSRTKQGCSSTGGLDIWMNRVCKSWWRRSYYIIVCPR